MIYTYSSKNELKFKNYFKQLRDDEKPKRPDLYILATSYVGHLKAKASTMIRENDFHQVSEKVT